MRAILRPPVFQVDQEGMWQDIFEDVEDLVVSPGGSNGSICGIWRDGRSGPLGKCPFEDGSPESLRCRGRAD